MTIPTSVRRIESKAFARNPGVPSLGGKVEGRYSGNLGLVYTFSDANMQIVAPFSIDDCFDFDAAKGEITNYKK